LLGETFGTKKVKQALSSQERNQIDMSQLQASSAGFINRNLDKTIKRMDSIIESGSDNPVNGASAVSSIISLLPPHNLTATKVEDIYQIKEIIPTEIYHALPIDDFSNDSTESWEALQSRYMMSDYV